MSIQFVFDYLKCTMTIFHSSKSNNKKKIEIQISSLLLFTIRRDFIAYSMPNKKVSRLYSIILSFLLCKKTFYFVTVTDLRDSGHKACKRRQPRKRKFFCFVGSYLVNLHWIIVFSLSDLPI